MEEWSRLTNTSKDLQLNLPNKNDEPIIRLACLFNTDLVSQIWPLTLRHIFDQDACCLVEY